MAWSLAPSCPCLPPSSLTLQSHERLTARTHGLLLCKPASSDRHLPPCKATKFEGATQETGSSGSSARAQLELLEQLTSITSENGYQSDSSDQKPTIREQLAKLIGDTDGEFSLPLGKKMKASMNLLTISQKRNIKRQAYLNEVSQRNDSAFFATIGAFVILPPVIILSIAILTGYVQLFPS